MSTYEKIKSAIENKQIVNLFYNGFYREMCPHVIGTKDNCKKVIFYQFKTTSPVGVSRYTENIWVCIPIDEIKDIEVYKGSWRSAKDLPNFHECFDDIDCMVDFSVEL